MPIRTLREIRAALIPKLILFSLATVYPRKISICGASALCWLQPGAEAHGQGQVPSRIQKGKVAGANPRTQPDLLPNVLHNAPKTLQHMIIPQQSYKSLYSNKNTYAVFPRRGIYALFSLLIHPATILIQTHTIFEITSFSPIASMNRAHKLLVALCLGKQVRGYRVRHSGRPKTAKTHGCLVTYV